MSLHPKSTTDLPSSVEKPHSRRDVQKSTFARFLGADRFSTFATVSAKSCLSEWPHSAIAPLAKFSQERAQAKWAQQKILHSVLLPMQDNKSLLETEPTKKATMVKVAVQGWRPRAIWWLDPCSQSAEGWRGGEPLIQPRSSPLAPCPTEESCHFWRPRSCRHDAGGWSHVLGSSPSSELTRNKTAETRSPTCLCPLPPRGQRERFTRARSMSWVARPSRTAFIVYIPKW